MSQELLILHNDADNHPKMNQQLHPIVKTVRDLLDEAPWRYSLYLFLIVLSIVPILADAADVFLDNYDGNQFCGKKSDCAVAFIGCIFLCIGLGILCIFKIYYWSDNSEHQWRKMNLTGMICIVVGYIILFSAFCLVLHDGNTNSICYEFISNGCPKHYKNECKSEHDTEAYAKKWCRIRYPGRNSFWIFIILCLIIEFIIGKQWANRKKQRYYMLRLSFFNLALLISSVCSVVTYIGNMEIYVDESMGTVTWGTCVGGYIIFITVMTLSWLIYVCRNTWLKCIGNTLSFFLLMGAILVQAKMYDDSAAKFVIMSAVTFVDIQVLSNQ